MKHMVKQGQVKSRKKASWCDGNLSFIHNIIASSVRHEL